MAKRNDWGFGTSLGPLPLSISDFHIVKTHVAEIPVVVFVPSTEKAKEWIRTNQSYLGIRTKYLTRAFAVKASHDLEIARKIKRDGLTAFFSTQEINAHGKE